MLYCLKKTIQTECNKTQLELTLSICVCSLAFSDYFKNVAKHLKFPFKRML